MQNVTPLQEANMCTQAYATYSSEQFIQSLKNMIDQFKKDTESNEGLILEDEDIIEKNILKE